MDNSAKLINEVIKKRRAIFPASYIDKPIPKATIRQILQNANWAPSHKLTAPWRFKIFRNESLSGLGRVMAKAYQKHTAVEKFKRAKFEKIQKKATQCDTIIAICMQRDPAESLPEWEEIAAVACSVQNMWLTCTAYEIGCYWSSPKDIIEHANDFLTLKEGERCLGFLYMGFHNMPEIEGKRAPIEDKVEWFD